jgi:UDP-glucose 4-epimerase
VLVTGGAGYIGSITAKLLLEEGADVVVLDTLENGHAEALDSGIALVEGDVADREALRELLPEVDVVLHCAGYIEVAESQQLPGRYFDNNVRRPLVMLEEMRSANVDAIVFSSTAAVYGQPESIPIVEQARTAPINAYGASKLSFENALEWMSATGELRAIRFRYFNVAGAWPDGSLGEAHDPETHIIPRLLGACAEGRREFEVYGGDYPTPDGTCVRDYLHVCDLARAHLMAVRALYSGESGGVYNLGNGDGYSNLEVVSACAKAVGTEIDITIGERREGDPAMLVASADAARERFGWVPERPSIDTITADAWLWHRTHPKGFHG